MQALINRARLNPAGEALRYGIALNEGVPAASTITTASKQPLAFSNILQTSADLHSQNMIDRDFFAHNDPLTGTTPQTRANAAGYAGLVGENIAFSGSTGQINATQMIYDQHETCSWTQGSPIAATAPTCSMPITMRSVSAK